MKTKRAIKRMLLTLMWLGVAAGMVTVITAAMRAQQAGACKGYEIKIKGFRSDMLFTSKDQIVKLLKAATKGDVKGQRKSDFNLPVIEDLLEQSSWVYNADLYFDNNDILHANVVEREPLARIFTRTGESFYIDEAGKHIPLSDKVSLDIPVFTGYQSKKVMNTADSMLLQNMIATASFVSSDSFWNAQVAQIDIKNCGADCWNMEMIPLVGNHKVDLGDGSDIASKFHRMYLFYDQVLKRTGFDKYQKIDVQYNGQVVGIKGDHTNVDSMQLRRNIEDLLVQSRQTNEMLEVAPTLARVNGLLQDTSAETKMLFANPVVDNMEDGKTFVDEADEIEAPKPAPVVVKKEKSKSAAKKEAKNPEMPAPKREVKKAEPKKAVVKKETTVKKASANNTNKPADKKPVVKKEAPKKTAIVKPAAKKEEKKPAAKTITGKTPAATKKPEAKKIAAGKKLKPVPKQD